MIIVTLGILALSLAFGLAWINTRMAGLIWVSFNFLAFQGTVEATRIEPELVVKAANVTLGVLVLYLSIMSLSGIGAAFMVKRARSHGIA